jgi:hypothetical protein
MAMLRQSAAYSARWAFKWCVLTLALLALSAAPALAETPCNPSNEDMNPHCPDVPETPSILIFVIGAAILVLVYFGLRLRRSARREEAEG